MVGWSAAAFGDDIDGQAGRRSPQGLEEEPDSRPGDAEAPAPGLLGVAAVQRPSNAYLRTSPHPGERFLQGDLHVPTARAKERSQRRQRPAEHVVRRIIDELAR